MHKAAVTYQFMPESTGVTGSTRFMGFVIARGLF